MRRRKVIWFFILLFGLVYLNNASWIAGPADGELSILAHRGVHQTYHRRDLDNETCTAERIDPLTHSFLENTLESMDAAKSYGADLIELDIHPTTDGEFVVFHDWTLDCRTNGTGRTRDHDRAYLQSLDIGYGYTSDGGETYPLRGRPAGEMPTLREVLTRFPETKFLVNIKSRSKKEARALLNYIPEDHWTNLSFVAHPDPLDILKTARPDKIYVSRKATKSCLKSYLFLGWSGYVPKDCHNIYVYVPANLRRLAWGWPHRFEKRLNAVGSRSMLAGDLGSHLAGGIDQQRDIDRIPEGYSGIVYTNKIEIVGPELSARGQSSE